MEIWRLRLISAQVVVEVEVGVELGKKAYLWVWDRFAQIKIPLCGSILQAKTCQIFSLAENPIWSQVWQQPQNKKNLFI